MSATVTAEEYLRLEQLYATNPAAYRRFFPRFDKVTFAMRRGQEYEADAMSARATSSYALSSALCRLHVLDSALNNFLSDA